jgi:hypothetical protein
MEWEAEQQAIDDYFRRDPFSEFWDATDKLRASTNEGRLGQFVKLSERTSQLAELGGFRVFSRLWPWRKEFAEVIVARDCGFDDFQLPRGYSIKVMRSGHEEVVVFSTGDSQDESKNLDAVVREFSLIVTDLIHKAKSNALKTADYSSWEGRHWREILREEYFETNLSIHKAFFGGYWAGLAALAVLIVFVGPAAAIALAFFGISGAYFTILAFFKVDPAEGKYIKSPNYRLRVYGGLLMIGLAILAAVTLYDPIISVTAFFVEFKDRLFD